ncbi:hypothetical protein RHMOL_Rhmol04G0289300 [Rhododendron molle]|uniref:Uncharacterized protein n=1 Tax=Rhododendron molle TaxID=49168 RepID=A0ACC0P5J3_RHOML|nr:hypothetical protein RHMOL_Rhmol04G0289300 [Rhododendron molle]
MRGPTADPTGYGTRFQIFGNTLTGNTVSRFDSIQTRPSTQLFLQLIRSLSLYLFSVLCVSLSLLLLVFILFLMGFHNFGFLFADLFMCLDASCFLGFCHWEYR